MQGEGILRMRYRDSREHASLINPGQGMPDHTRSLVDPQCVPSRAYTSFRNLQQQIPSIRWQPQYRRRNRIGAPVCFRHEHDFSRCPASFGAGTSGNSLRVEVPILAGQPVSGETSPYHSSTDGCVCLADVRLKTDLSKQIIDHASGIVYA